MGGQQSQIQDVSDLRCPPNSYFTKVKTRSGVMVDKIELWCKDGTYKSKGRDGGGENNAFECSQGFDEIKFRTGDKLDSIQFRCSDGRWSDRWGGTGGSETHRKNCSEIQKVITGLSSIGIKENVLSAGTDIDKIIECGDRVNCLDDTNLFHEECKFRTDSSYKTKLQEFCNRNDTNALSSGCINWCRSNSTSCTRYNDLTDCTKYGITVGDCNRSKIDQTQTLCGKYKIIQSDVGGTGIYPCNINSIKELEKECKDYDINLDSCSPDSLENAKNRGLTIALQQEAEKKAAERYQSTQQSINQVLGITTQPTTTTPPPVTEDYTMYIIIAIIIIFLSMLSSSSCILLFMSGEE
jgi:hypothetical protein